MTAILERNPATSDQIELCNTSQKPREAADTAIVALSALDPSDAMNKCCKMKIKITGVISTENWWYMGCKECWKKLKKENGVYNHGFRVATRMSRSGVATREKSSLQCD